MRPSPLLVAAAALACSCTAHAPFRVVPTAVETSPEKLAAKPGQAEAAHHSIEVHPSFTLAFVEFDDQGRFWDTEQLAALERALEEEAGKARGGVIVPIFTHGWQHDAGVCDENVACYRTFLAHIAQTADAVTRLSGGRMPSRRVVGIYAGWRGRSGTVKGLRDLTFWARKRVALRIGSGDLIALFSRVDAFVKRMNAGGVDRARLVTIGHSFGATAVFTALSNILKMRLVEAIARQENPERRVDVVEGFGDLVVLVNPAFEASHFLTLHDLAGSLESLSFRQSPILIVVQSESDTPNRTWFPLGQWFSTLFLRAANDAERVSMRTSVGNYQEFWDYRLTAAPGVIHASTDRSDSISLRGSNCVCDLDLEASDADLERLVSMATRPEPAAPSMASDRNGNYGRSVLACLKPHERATPLWVVRASEEVIPGHNRIFTNPFIDFVRQVVFESLARKSRRDAPESAP